ncbi:hypothetical protein BLL40_04260 [Domibacillus mangrovi]|uniref:Uncharacterized protein n=1 Tax=Domibacillus mangrovi TaxID=1714354 RepID=A0A1Q5P5I1_9BACI|nr:hypothetical protein BLL40_04260 [Domibacillus mangrovi]
MYKVPTEIYRFEYTGKKQVIGAKEFIGKCEKCGESIYCMDGFFCGIKESGKLFCFNCADEKK